MAKCVCSALPRLAQSIAAAIFQVEAGKAGRDEILEALSELIHIIGGNLKPLLFQPVILSLPSLPDPVKWAQATPQWPWACRLTLVSQGHPFVVSRLGDSSIAETEETPTDWESRLPAENP